MNKPTILIAGKSETSFPTVNRIYQHDAAWATTEVATAEEAIEKFHQQDFEIVILADGLSGRRRKKIAQDIYVSES